MRFADIRVVPVGDLFRVEALFLPGTDEMWERISHPALFRNLNRAEVFARKIGKNLGKVNLSEWWIEGSRVSPLASNRPPIYCVL